MTGRRLAALAALMLLPACAMQSGGPSATPSSDGALSTVSATTSITPETPSARKPKGAKTAKAISIRVLPQIAHPGAKKASAASARTPVTVAVSPRRRTQVALQVATGESWKRVAGAVTDKGGRHVFHAAPTYGGKAATYRVVVGRKVSASASTAAWLKPKFTENFSGRKLSNVWSHRMTKPNRAGGRVCSRGSAQATKVAGGTARLSVIRDKSKKNKKCRGVLGGKTTGQFNYRLNGHIATQNKVSFKYGFAAARIKMPKSQGQHGGFWLQPQVHVSGTVNPKLTGAEIDVIESFGAGAGPKDSMGLSSFTYHWKLKGNRGIQTKVGGYLKNVPSYLSGKGDAWHRRYHVFSVEWTPREYIFRIDGKETWRSKAGVSGQPQYAILSLLSSDYELHRLEGGDKKLPQHMYVDWMRIWETS